MVVEHQCEHRLRVRVAGDVGRAFVFGLDLLEVSVRLVAPRAHQVRPGLDLRVADAPQRVNHLRGRFADLCRCAERNQVLDPAHEEPRSRTGVDPIKEGQERRRRELDPLGRAVGLPQEGIYATGRLDAPARVDCAGLVEAGPGEIRSPSAVTGQTGGVGRVEEQRRVVDAGDLGRVVDRCPPAQGELVVVDRGLIGEALLRVQPRRRPATARPPAPREPRANAGQARRPGRCRPRAWDLP